MKEYNLLPACIMIICTQYVAVPLQSLFHLQNLSITTR